MAADTEGAWDPEVIIKIAAPTVVDPTDASVSFSDPRGLFVIHTVLLRTGKLLWFCGHVEGMFYAPKVYLFDPTKPSSTQLKAIDMPPRTDLFCCHYVQLYDGRILIVGGSEQDEVSGTNTVYHGSSGAKTIAVFDPTTESWSDVDGLRLEHGRWYPTAVLLGDGRAVILSGRRESGAGSDSGRSGTGPISGNPASIADRVEVIAPRADGRKTMEGSPLQLPIYPGAHLGPDAPDVHAVPAVGRIYTTHTCWGQEIGEPPGQALTLTDTHATWTAFGAPAPQPLQMAREEGMSVLLPVTLPRASSWGRVLVIGGGAAQGRRRSDGAIGPILQVGGPNNADFIGHRSGIDTKAAEILDTTGKPTDVDGGAWRADAQPGVNGHCVLLPDATVLILGGNDAYKWQAAANHPGVTEATTQPSLPVEIFKPGVGFTVGAPLAHARMYHSAALLMADGRVIIAGGADPNENEPPTAYPANWHGRTYSGGPPGVRRNGQPGSGAALNRKDYQIYKPPYFFKGPQSTITNVVPGTQVLYGATFTITTPQAAAIRHVAVMRPGAVTHHTDSEQRYVELAFTVAGNGLTVTMVPATESWVAPPGYYMLWIVDDQDRPCEQARWIQVVHPAPWPPITPKSRWPCFVATVALGSDQEPVVRHLRRVRDELDGSGALAHRFIALVNDGYYSFSPALARWLERHDRARWAVRDVVVRPAALAVRGADAITRPVRPRCLRPALLIVLLVIFATVAVVVAPLAAMALAVHVLVSTVRGDRARPPDARAAGSVARDG